MFSFSLIILFGIIYMPHQSMEWHEVSSPAMTGAIQNGSAFGRSKRATTCILPAYPDYGTYDVLNLNKTQSGQSYSTVILSVRCQRGYGLENSVTPYGNSSLVLCDQGVWYQTIPKCVRFCKLDPDASVEYRCHIPDVGFRTCEGYLAPGTLVSPVCKSPEYSSNTDIVLDMECIGGQWNYIATCKADQKGPSPASSPHTLTMAHITYNDDCGRAVPDGGIGLIAGGTYSTYGQVPWHVGIYRKTTTPYELLCGGTIVTTKVVISAAHCFRSRIPSEYAVAAGKIHRLWDENLDIYAQKSDVIAIKIPPLYQGATGHFGVDISVVVLVSPFVLNPFVRLVCLSFDANFDRWQLQQGQLGKVAGWGLTSANGAAATILQVVDLPFINENLCLNSVPLHFKPYITGDKFCAGYTNGTALCEGDSGAGLVFSDKEWGKEGRYYLRGIVSTAPRNDDVNIICNDITFTAFTRVAVHQDFIKNVIAVSERKSCQGADCDGDCEDGSDACKPVTSIEKIKPETISNSGCGQPTTTNAVPWLVAIFKKNVAFTCAGTAVSNRHIITAASCMQMGTQILNYKDILVKISLFDSNEREHVLHLLLIFARIHKDYNPDTLENDLMLLLVKIPGSYPNSYLRPACLWSGDIGIEAAVLPRAIAANWGPPYNGLGQPSVHQVTYMAIRTNRKCLEYSPELQSIISDTTVCAADGSLTGPCKGAPGSGLYLTDSGIWKLRGILSLPLQQKHGVCNITKFVIFTDVARFLPWIKEVINE